MKKCIFSFVASLLSIAMFANDATFTFSGQNSKEEACTLTKVVVQNITQNWSETLEGPQFSITIEESSQGLESVLAENKALSLTGSNPFCGSTTLCLNLSKGGDVRMSLVDLTGKTLYSTSANVEAGYYSLQVNLQMPQLYFLSVETPQGTYNAKLINQGIGLGTGVSISTGGIRNMPVKANSGNVYFDGDEMRFTGYTVVDGKEYTAEQKLTVTSGMSKKVVFTFDLPIKPAKPQSGMYVGIIGFNDQLTVRDIAHLTKSTNSAFKTWISNLKMGDGTKLYHADWTALDNMDAFVAPEDLTNVSIVTFTDGLDLGSYTQNPLFQARSAAEYLDSVSHRIKNNKINDVEITAYSIGVQGSDVKAANLPQFEKNLNDLASDKANVFKVNNMNEVSKKFDSIAEALHKVSIINNITFKIAPPDPNTFIRFTLDIEDENEDDVTKAKMWISAKYNRIQMSDGTLKGCLTELEYNGLTCLSKDTIWASKDDSGEKPWLNGNGNTDYWQYYSFNDLKDEKGDISKYLQTENMRKYTKLWRRATTQVAWTRDSEFHPEDMPEQKIEDSSALIMLVMDCSSSLGDKDFATLKEAAKNFMDKLTPTNDPTPDPDPETPDPKPASEYYMKHAWGEGTGDVWSWKKMTKVSDDVFTCEGTWGGSGVNINTTASDDNAVWFADTDIQGASSLSLGDGVKFTYNVSKNTVTAEKTSSGGNVTNYYIKHPWGTGADADWKWRTMTQKSADEYVCKGKWGGVGANINTIAGDTGAEWFAEEDIIGSSQLDLGDCVLFTYKVSSGTLTVSIDTGCE